MIALEHGNREMRDEITEAKYEQNVQSIGREVALREERRKEQ